MTKQRPTKEKVECIAMRKAKHSDFNLNFNFNFSRFVLYGGLDYLQEIQLF